MWSAVACYRFCPCAFTRRAPADACLGIRSVRPSAPPRPPLQIAPPAAPPAHHSEHTATRHCLPARPSLSQPFSFLPRSRPCSPRQANRTCSRRSRHFALQSTIGGFLPPMQHRKQSAARFHRRKRRNSESRPAVQGLTIALTPTKQRRNFF